MKCREVRVSGRTDYNAVRALKIEALRRAHAELCQECFFYS
jgi:hypothetical protein